MGPSSAVILLVDVDEDNRRQLGRLLDRDGYRVKESACLLSAVESAIVEIPEVIIVARYLSILHAEELLKLRHSHTPFAGVPIVVYGDAGDAGEELLAFGLDDFVSLPLDYRFLRLRLRMLLSRRRSKGVEGDLAHLPVLDLVQTLSSFARSGTLELECVSTSGTIHFQTGQIVAASSGSKTGEDALIGLLRQATSGGRFSFDAGNCASVERSINRPTSHILLGLASALDEGNV